MAPGLPLEAPHVGKVIRDITLPYMAEFQIIGSLVLLLGPRICQTRWQTQGKPKRRHIDTRKTDMAKIGAREKDKNDGCIGELSVVKHAPRS